MKEYLSGLTPQTLERLRKQLSREEELPEFRRQPLPTAAQYLKNQWDVDVQLAHNIITDGLVVGTVRLPRQREQLAARLYGVYLTEQYGGSSDEDCKQHEHLYKIISKKECSLKEPRHIFLEEQSTVEWQSTQEAAEGRFEFIVETTHPNSLCFRMGRIVKTVAYVVEVVGEGLHFLQPVEIRYSSDFPSIDKELSYAAVDFQLMRTCCMSKGVFRLEAILPTNSYELDSIVLGRINYFRKSKGDLSQLEHCRVDLIARIKWLSRSSKECSYIPVASKSIWTNTEPEYGMVVGRYRLPLSASLPPTCSNILFTITYFLLLTPVGAPHGHTIRLMEEHIREMYITGKE